MAKIDCTACEDLRDSAPDYAVNGVTDTVCNYLKNNTGLSGDSDNCTDLDIVNDCTIGMMDQVLDAYDVCDWKEFMHKYVPNEHQLNKALICALCGLLEKVDKLQCVVNTLTNGVRFRIREQTDGDAYAVAGKGVSFLTSHGDEYGKSDIYLLMIAGGHMMGGGSYRFYSEDFQDEAECGNFDLGTDFRKTQARLGNPIWNTMGRPATGGELICEFRIKESAYPYVSRIYGGGGHETGGGAYRVNVSVYNGADPTDPDDPTTYVWAPGQHGGCAEDGGPGDVGYDSGHVVPAGWIYVQLRMTYMEIFSANGSVGSQYTPRYWMGIRINQDEVEC